MFIRSVQIFFAASLIHAVLAVIQLGTPIGLLTPPLLLHMTKLAAGSKLRYWYLHYLVFVLMTLAHCTLLATDFFIKFDSHYSGWYYQIYFLSMTVMLLTYPIVSFKDLKTNNGMATVTEQFLSRLVFISFAIGLFFIALTVNLIYHVVDLGFDPRLIIYGFQGLTIILTAFYIIKEYPESKNLTYKTKYHKANPSHDFERLLKDSQLYLDPNLTIRKFADHLGIPDKELSSQLNQNLGTSFYGLLSKCRIDHACTIMNTVESITIESLAADCGFNSKSSFNKYFKFYTGFVPSDYRKNNSAVQELIKLQ